MDISSNGKKVIARLRKRTAAAAIALAHGLQKWAADVDERQVKNLSGSNTAVPGTYPVPNRSGNLLQSHFFAVKNDRLAIVGNTAAYAVPVHDGVPSRGIEPRPFLTDAAEASPGIEFIDKAIRRDVLAI